MSVMMDKVEKIRYAFLDVDNTLLYLKMYSNEAGENDKQSGKRIVGQADYLDWLRYNINNNAYIHCEAPEPIQKLLLYLKKRGVKIFGLSECSNSFEYNAKFNRLRECYEGNFLHHGDLISIDDRHKKITIIKMIAERDGIDPEEIMFVDDAYTEVMEAFQEGILAIHTTEALIRFANLEP
ncbi:hypothetical protein SAMN02910358_01319 [Lachnospiraceae bacterium XBB1006]|nr:hypothetical protein SAMN02910358_01319 [Lachnospiraceae bacterium XBB1006]